MLVGLLRAAAVAALCLAAVAQPTEARLHSHKHSAIRNLANTASNVKASADYVMPFKYTTDNLDWNTNILTTFDNRRMVDDMKNVGINSMVLAFASGECGSENWDGVKGSDMANANVGILQQAGVKVRLSSGGASATFTCGSSGGFDQWIGQWNNGGVLEGVDFDIENGQSWDQISALVTRVKEGVSKYPNLVFSFTVAAVGASMQGQNWATPYPQGQAPDPFDGGVGQTVVQEISRQMGFQQGNPASWPSNRIRINPMAMDYGTASNDNCVLVSSGPWCNMGQTAIQIAYNLNGHWGVPMNAIELTPMIGDQDSAGESFTSDDGATLVRWAEQNGVAKIHYWSYDRDTPCGNNPPPSGSSSDTCNTVGTSEHQFINAMSQA